jgi:hypothetical protein
VVHNSFRVPIWGLISLLRRADSAQRSDESEPDARLGMGSTKRSITLNLVRSPLLAANFNLTINQVDELIDPSRLPEHVLSIGPKTFTEYSET